MGVLRSSIRILLWSVLVNESCMREPFKKSIATIQASLDSRHPGSALAQIEVPRRHYQRYAPGSAVAVLSKRLERSGTDSLDSPSVTLLGLGLLSPLILSVSLVSLRHSVIESQTLKPLP